MIPQLLLGLQHALLILALELVFGHLLAFVPPGTRAQATGVCVTTLVMLLSGVLLGARAQRRLLANLAAADLGIEGAEGSKGKQALRLLEETLVPWRAPPWGAVFTTALILGAVGLLFSFTEIATGLVPPEAMAPGGVGRAIFGTNAVVLPAAIFVGLGGMLGANAGPWALPTTLLGVAVYGAAAGGFGALAPFLSYDPTIIAALVSLGGLLAALLTGFVVAWVARRLLFVEVGLIALLVGYGLYLLVAIGPLEVARASNLPEEQVFLALAFFPTVVLAALLTVGASVGFLLFGGGRFDPGFRYELQVALRYVKAQRRERFVGVVTAIAVVGVCLGVMALIIVLSIMSGFENDLKMKILGAHAHVVVNKHGDDFTEYGEVEAQVRTVPGVIAAQAFTLGDAMISTDVGLSGTLVKGISARSDGAAELERIMEKGRLEHLLTPEEIPGARTRLGFAPPPLEGDPTAPGAAPPLDPTDPVIREPAGGKKPLPGIVIGRELARTLRAYVGDTVKLVSPASEEIGPLGPTPKLRRFRVAGIFYSGMYEYDAKFTYIDLGQAQRFFGMSQRATGVEMKVRDIDQTARIVEEVKRRVGGEPYVVKDWRSMNKELFSALLLEKLAMFIALGMIVMVASFLIVAVLVMIVLQRKKEIAILKSLGASDASIMKVFVIQGLILGLGGALLGGGLGVGICLFLERFGVDLDEKIFYIERLPVVMDWGEISAIAIAAVIMSYLATIYPAMTAARQRPVEGLRDD